MSRVPCSLAVRLKPMMCTACELSPHTVSAEEVRNDVAHHVAASVKEDVAHVKGAGAVAIWGPDVLIVYGDKLVPYVMRALQELKDIGGEFGLLDPTVVEPVDLEEAIKDCIAQGANVERYMDGAQDVPVERYGSTPSMN
jgi:deoxyxylulose-5-phosphate synthase